jgi:DNA-directed RNA polymerase II subunit RPB2
MTISQLLEVVMAKTKALTGMDYDASPFRKDLKMEDVCEDLHTTGYQKHGWERMYCGSTGKSLNAMIFIGPTYYQRLKHMVADKYHCRSTGITQTLTRQPTEGRSKDGGLRFGEVSVCSKNISCIMIDFLTLVFSFFNRWKEMP